MARRLLVLGRQRAGGGEEGEVGERLVREAERWLRRKSYETGHFDRVIVNYREVQKPMRLFSPGSRSVLGRLLADVG